MDVGVPQVKVGVRVARHLLVRLGVDDFLNLLVDEVVERVDVLPHQAAHLEERREELELVLQRLDGGGEFGGVPGETVLDIAVRA